MAKINNTALLVFAKAPIPGQVKTRLIPAIGKEYSTRLYIELFHHTMDVALRSSVNEIQIWCSPSVNASCFQDYSREEKVSLHVQQGNSLGDRMSYALNKGLNNFNACVLVGCDCPDLNSQDIEQAYGMLDSTDVVIGPAQDGGYYLLALAKSSFQIFEDIEWGSSSVLQKTKQNLKRLDWEWQELRMLNDIDTVSDLSELKKYKMGGFLNGN